MRTRLRDRDADQPVHADKRDSASRAKRTEHARRPALHMLQSRWRIQPGRVLKNADVCAKCSRWSLRAGANGPRGGAACAVRGSAVPRPGRSAPAARRDRSPTAAATARRWVGQAWGSPTPRAACRRRGYGRATAGIRSSPERSRHIAVCGCSVRRIGTLRPACANRYESPMNTRTKCPDLFPHPASLPQTTAEGPRSSRRPAAIRCSYTASASRGYP